MFVNFIGSPSSGKTTVAALVFAQLKESGFPAEFLPESARRYIAERRVDLKGTKLTDFDQLCIMNKQFRELSVFNEFNNTTVVCDSSPLLSLLYMTEEYKDLDNVPHGKFLRELIEKSISIHESGITFYCPPVPPSLIDDPNRVHSHEESLALDNQVFPTFAKYAPNIQVIPLSGDAHNRANKALEKIYARINA